MAKQVEQGSVALASVKTGGKSIDTAKANAKASAAKGAALADLCIKYLTEEMQAEEQRGAKRMMFVRDISNLNPEGHGEFRAEMQRQLNFLTESEKAAVQVGALKEEVSRHGGYSLASFRVMVSNWRTLSVACEHGLNIYEADKKTLKPWETVLMDARALRKAEQAAGDAASESGGRAQGAGRKADTKVDRAFKIAMQLSIEEQAELIGRIQAAMAEASKADTATATTEATA